MPRSKPKKRNKAPRTPRTRTEEAHLPVVPPSESVGREKMSEVLIDFVEPYEDLAETLEEHKMLMELGALAWNIALFPKELRNSLFSQFPRRKKASPPDEGELFIRELVHRKDRHFADCSRMIVDVEVTEEGDDFRVHVASTPMDLGPEGLPGRRSWSRRNLFGIR